MIDKKAKEAKKKQAAPAAKQKGPAGKYTHFMVSAFCGTVASTSDVAGLGSMEYPLPVPALAPLTPRCVLTFYLCVS